MTTTATINVESLTKKINAQGIKKKQNAISAEKAYFNGVIKKVKHINAHFLKDALKLIELFKAMKANNLQPYGEMTDSYGYRYEFKANGIEHRIGFILYQNGLVGICCLGGGYDANTSAILGLNGNKLMWGDENGTPKGDMITMLSNPSAYLRRDYMGEIKHFEDRINTIYNGFIKFRDSYLAHIQKQLGK